MLRHLKLKMEIKTETTNLCLSVQMMRGYQKNIKAIWTKIEGLKNIELNALQVYDDRYIKTKIRTYRDKVYTNFRGLNVPEDDIKCESFTVIPIDSLLAYKNEYYLQVYLDNYAYKISNKKMTDYLDDNLFEGQIL